MTGPRSDDPRFRAVELDGQRLLLPSAALTTELLAAAVLDGRPLGTGRLFAQYAALADTVDGLMVALGAVPEAHQPWWIYHLAQTAEGLLRVRTVGQRCFGCGWKGITGVSRDYAIYLGTADPLRALGAHRDDRTQGCPKCGTPFQQPAVFASD